MISGGAKNFAGFFVGIVLSTSIDEQVGIVVSHGIAFFFETCGIVFFEVFGLVSYFFAERVTQQMASGRYLGFFSVPPATEMVSYLVSHGIAFGIVLFS